MVSETGWVRGPHAQMKNTMKNNGYSREETVTAVDSIHEAKMTELNKELRKVYTE